MWWKWFPWRFLVRNVARRQRFPDPIRILSEIQGFAQPAEVAAPTELLRSGVVLHARGLMNSLAIQHNLDWVWPFWVERQYDPGSESFIPRSFSLTQINLTHRNWTAVGIPGFDGYPLVDPRGMVTPCFDGWSLEAWILYEDGQELVPARAPHSHQQLDMDRHLKVLTHASSSAGTIRSEVSLTGDLDCNFCGITWRAWAPKDAWLVVSVRPYNPEGVSFIHKLAMLPQEGGWLVNGKQHVFLSAPPQRWVFSTYRNGDVYSQWRMPAHQKEVQCPVGMATAAAIYALSADEETAVALQVPLKIKSTAAYCVKDTRAFETASQRIWLEGLAGQSRLQVPDKHFLFLYQAAVRSLVLHSPLEVYPGPYTYRRFWFRDAAFIIYALLCVGFRERALMVLNQFYKRQTAMGYFESQEGEWDSNGEVLWILAQFCRLTGEPPPAQWQKPMLKGAHWLCRKLLPRDTGSDHAGLLPAGFSAEHLGPNDYYYWDDFWAVAGLKSAAYLTDLYGLTDEAQGFLSRASRLSADLDQSLRRVSARLQRPAMPASPYRRLDSGCIGSLAAGYPLKLFPPDDPRLMDTARFLMDYCLINGGFFHDMTHSGINPYLTFHLAQVLLRAGDARYFSLIKVVAELASATGQWPEAIHPKTLGGCMGDGQHIWAAAEWVLMMRHCFVREEGEGLILASGIPREWLGQGEVLSFGPAATEFGDILLSLQRTGQDVVVEWKADWRQAPKLIVVQLPFCAAVTAEAHAFRVSVRLGDDRRL